MCFVFVFCVSRPIKINLNHINNNNINSSIQTTAAPGVRSFILLLPFTQWINTNRIFKKLKFVRDYHCRLTRSRYLRSHFFVYISFISIVIILRVVVMMMNDAAGRFLLLFCSVLALALLSFRLVFCCLWPEENDENAHRYFECPANEDVLVRLLTWRRERWRWLIQSQFNMTQFIQSGMLSERRNV